MNWELVKIKNGSKGRTAPYASVGFGRITLSSAACDLLGDYQKYKYVELYRGKQAGKTCIGVKFLLEGQRTDNSLPISRRYSKGKPVGGMDISNKGTLEELFGPIASASKATRMSAKLDDDCKDLIVIYAE